MRLHLSKYWSGLLLLLVPLWVTAGTDASLIDAARNQDFEGVRALLYKSVDVNLVGPDGATALHWAVHRDDLKLAGLLTDSGANAGVTNDYGITPLWLACTNRNAEMVNLLLQAGGDANASKWTGESVLLHCARTGATVAVEALLKAGADVNATEEYQGQTPLMWAAAGGHAAITRMLIAHGADINQATRSTADRVPNTCRICEWKPSPGGFTPLMFAARAGDIDTANYIINAGAEIDQATDEHGTPLVIASASGHEDLALFLLGKGADPDAMDENGVTALHYAFLNGLSNMHGMTYDPVYRIRPSNMPRLARALLETGTDPNVQIRKSYKIGPAIRDSCESLSNMVGATPFMLAAISVDVPLMQLLEVYEADPQIASKDGTTPLMVAARAACKAQNEEDNNADKVLARSLEAVRAIVDMGVDVNAVNEDGNTALHLAAFSGADPIVQFLVDKGAGIDARNKMGETPWSMASGISPSRQDTGEYGIHESTAALLMALGAVPIAREDMFVPDAYSNFLQKEVSIDQ